MTQQDNYTYLLRIKGLGLKLSLTVEKRIGRNWTTSSGVMSPMCLQTQFELNYRTDQIKIAESRTSEITKSDRFRKIREIDSGIE